MKMLISAALSIGVHVLELMQGEFHDTSSLKAIKTSVQLSV
jgi:hypothetical protein